MTDEERIEMLLDSLAEASTTNEQELIEAKIKRLRALQTESTT